MNLSARLPSELTLRRAAALLALLGVAVAGYIAVADSASGAPACFAGTRGCQTVAHSRYAHLAGVNVAWIGVAGYAALLLAAAAGGDPGRIGGFALASIGLGYSLYLTYLELFVIEAICPWCVASALLMCALFAVCFARALGYAGMMA